MDITQLFDYAARWVFVCSIVSIILPPVEVLDDFPTAQKWYRLFGKFLKYFGSLDLRGKVIAQYPSYQKTLTGQEVSPFAKKD